MIIIRTLVSDKNNVKYVITTAYYESMEAWMTVKEFYNKEYSGYLSCHYTDCLYDNVEEAGKTHLKICVETRDS